MRQLMTVEEVMKYRRAEPFQSFVLVLKDGRRFPVRQPHEIGRDPGNTKIGVSADEESVETFAVSMVAGVELVPSDGIHASEQGQGK